MQKLLVAAIVLFSFSASAQSSVNQDSIKLRQYSVGLNALRLVPGYSSSQLSSVGYLQYRSGDNALRVGFSNVNSYRQNDDNINFPSSIFMTDSTLTVGEKYRSVTGGGASLEYLRYNKLIASNNAQLYGGIGVYGGSINDETGYNYTLYTKDSLGIYRINEQSNSNSEVDRFHSVRGFQAGVIPIVGVIVMPTNILSLSLEARLPFLYEQKHAYNKTNSVSGINMNTMLACNVIINLDVSK